MRNTWARSSARRMAGAFDRRAASRASPDERADNNDWIATMLGSHQTTYDAVFQHPISRNLQWRDLRSMLESLADVVVENNGNLKFTRNGQTLTVHPPRRKD